MKYDSDNCYHTLFKRYEANPILTCQDWPYPVNSVFNPGAAMVNGRYLLLVRVEDRRGFSHLCAAHSANGVSDWEIDPQPTLAPRSEKYPEETWGIEDPRITWLEDPGTVGYRLYCIFKGWSLSLPCHNQGFRQLREAWSCHASRGQRRRPFPYQVQGQICNAP